MKIPSIFFRWTPHPVMVTTRDNRDYIRVLSYSYYTTITGRGVLLTYSLLVVAVAVVGLSTKHHAHIERSTPIMPPTLLSKYCIEIEASGGET